MDGAGNRDPLNGVGNAELKIDEENKKIVGVIIMDDCVLYKC